MNTIAMNTIDGASRNRTGSEAWSGSWSHLSVDRRSPVYCRVMSDHAQIKTITATTVAELNVSELAANAIQHGSSDLYSRPVPVTGSVSAERRDGAARDDSGAPSDEDLLRRHVEGDPDAFGALFSRQRDRLWAVAIRTLGDPEEAADALQDAMISALRLAATFRGDSAVMTWLHRIVVNACLDRMRRRAARPTSGGHDDDALDRLAGTSRMSDPSGTTDTALDVRAALRRLVPEQQAALVLVDMLGYPIADAAEALGVSQGTVKSRAARGRARLLPRLAHLRPGRDRRDRPAGLTSTRGARGWPRHVGGEKPGSDQSMPVRLPVLAVQQRDPRQRDVPTGASTTLRTRQVVTSLCLVSSAMTSCT
jgi:RNA polymerase sigma-70 factor, ECF subfamily